MRNLMGKFWFLLCVLVVGSQSVYAVNVGTVVDVSGDVWLMEAGKAWRLTVEDKVDSEQTIITEENGLVQIELTDGSLLNIASRTRIKLDKYVVEEHESFSFDVLWGIVRYKVNKIIDPNNAFNVKTTTAAVGVRGTNFEVRMPYPENMKGLQFSPSASLNSIDLQTSTIDMDEGLTVLTDLKGREHELPAGTVTTVDKDANVIQIVKGAPKPRPIEIPQPTVFIPEIKTDTQAVAAKAAITTGVNASALQSATITPPRVSGFGGR